MKKDKPNLAIIGSGATTVYLLKHFLDHIGLLMQYIGELAIFEKEAIMGAGMPYSPETTDDCNLSNISSEELPPLCESFANWLKKQDDAFLANLGIEKSAISESAVYSRLALGEYLCAQYAAIVDKLQTQGMTVLEYPNCEVTDVNYDLAQEKAHLHCNTSMVYTTSMLVISTGHRWEDTDKPDQGYYNSPWPIFKVLPQRGQYFNFKIGILGASLSAFDVVSSLSRRHGEFKTGQQGRMTYHPFEGTAMFHLTLHDAHGWLPHLQYEQEEPLREIYRHFSRDDLFGLVDDNGFLRIETYFDKICRPALRLAFEKDRMPDLRNQLSDPEFGLIRFVEKMSRKHEYDDPFEGMRAEMQEAKHSVYRNKPIHWKEVVDDLMYALNFHAGLMPAEDHLIFHEKVMPFLMNVIAAMPLPSGQLLLALHDAGKLALVKGYAEMAQTQQAGSITIDVDQDGEVLSRTYQLFIDCGGQQVIGYDHFPFEGLKKQGIIRKARIPFAHPEAIDPDEESLQKRIITENNRVFLTPGGIDIDAAYRIIGENGQPNAGIHDLSFTHTAGLRPYSYGLQACSSTSRIVVESWVKSFAGETEVQGDLKAISKIYDDDSNLL